MPYAVALEDVAAVLTPRQIANCTPLNLAQGAIISLVLQLDQGLDRLVSKGLVLELASPRPDETATLRVADLTEFVDQLRQVVSGSSRAAVGELSGTLARKMQGARDAIEHSADPVSQAASSLIELLDRLLRLAFSEQEVLDWCDINYDSAPDLEYQKDGIRRPTKRGQALCFAYASQPVSERSGLHEMLAAGLVATRNNLEQLKHADSNEPGEAEKLASHLASVEGFLHLAFGLAWALAPEEQVNRLRSRL